MIVDELVEKLKQMPPTAEVKIVINDRSHDCELMTDINHLTLTGWFNKEVWEQVETLNQQVELYGRYE